MTFPALCYEAYRYVRLAEELVKGGDNPELVTRALAHAIEVLEDLYQLATTDG